MDVTKLWERFFTEQDKAHDEVWGKKQPTGLGANPALILIDIYYGVLGFKRRTDYGANQISSQVLSVWKAGRR